MPLENVQASVTLSTNRESLSIMFLWKKEKEKEKGEYRENNVVKSEDNHQNN